MLYYRWITKEKIMDKYDIAFSYASEQRKIIKKYEKKLKELGLKVFIDVEHPELFVFNHVPDILKKIYDDSETVMLIFLSRDYAKKDFTKYEGHIAFDRLLTDKRLTIIKLDDSTLPWLPSSLFYYDINKYSFEEICGSLYSAIKGYQIPKLQILFKNVNNFLKSKFKEINCSLNTETCVIYRINLLDNEKIKITLNEGLDKILLFVCTDLECLFPVAEVYILKKNIVLENRGISHKLDLVKKYLNEDEMLCDLYNIIAHLLDKKYD